MYAEVAVNAAAPLRQTFTYHIPPGLDISIGHAVYVPWGRRTLQGIVCKITEVPAYTDARDIEGVIDEQPLVSAERVALALWMSNYYLSPLFDCVSLALPTGFKRRPLTYLRPAFWLEGDEALSEAETEVLRVINDTGEIELEALKRGVKATGAARAVTSLMKQGMIARTYRLARPAVTTKMVTIVRLALTENEAADVAGRMRQEATKRFLKSAALIETLIREESLPLSQARRLGLTPSLQRALDGIVAVNEETLVRDPLA